MKILTLGSRCITSQIDRIEKGIKQIGFDLTDNYDDADFVYCNNLGSYNSNFSDKTILNILDIPYHVREVNEIIKKIQNISRQVLKVTCISKSVQNQLLKIGVDSEVIYNPVKDVSFLGLESEFKFLYVGRAQDPNKRFYLSKDIVLNSGFSDSDLICVGEYGGFGKYAGFISDEDLNYAYNKTEFVLLTSKFEGLGLSMLEGLICRKMPIVLSDNVTAHEFIPKEMICDSVEDAILKIKQKERFQDIILELSQQYKIKFSKEQIAKNIIEVYKSC